MAANPLSVFHLHMDWGKRAIHDLEQAVGIDYRPIKDKAEALAKGWSEKECEEPWTPELGVNEYLPPHLQWYCTYAVPVCILVWLVTWNSYPVFSAWFPPMLMVVLGYPIFFGFVSNQPSNPCLKAFTTLVICTMVFAYLKALVPFLVGVLCGPVFLIVVVTAVDKKLVEYDYEWYSITVGGDTGMWNAITFLAVKHWGLPDQWRWILLSLGWPCIMSVIPCVLLARGMKFEAYKLNLQQMIRYSAFQFTLYIFIYYGVCKNLEQMAFAEESY